MVPLQNLTRFGRIYVDTMCDNGECKGIGEPVKVSDAGLRVGER